MSNSYFALTALSPLDGRYGQQLNEVSKLFSEFALVKKRVFVEVRYLVFLSKSNLIPKLTKVQEKEVLALASNFNLEQADQIKDIEKKTKHDVKAVEYWLAAELEKRTSPLSSCVHLALTSEDTNSLAYSLLLQTAKQELVIPHLRDLLRDLNELALKYQDTVMLARTHGQPAVPTTLGKEVLNFAMRLLTELQLLAVSPIEGKMSGAVGNFNAHSVAFKTAKSWLELSDTFIISLGLQPNFFTTQILPAESYTRFFSSLVRINQILIDLNQDMWRYISDGYLVQKLDKGQVGSSTMPHKVNPIDFENSEGNLGLANALLLHFIQKLPISRLQRDLSDSTVKRSMGTAIGYSILAYKSLAKGLSKVTANSAKLEQELVSHPEVLSEAFQVILRLHGDSSGYQKLQKLAQGKVITLSDLQTFIDTLDISDQLKKELKQLKPETYTGLASELTQQGSTIITNYLQGVS